MAFKIHPGLHSLAGLSNVAPVIEAFAQSVPEFPVGAVSPYPGIAIALSTQRGIWLASSYVAGGGVAYGQKMIDEAKGQKGKNLREHLFPIVVGSRGYFIGEQRYLDGSVDDGFRKFRLQTSAHGEKYEKWCLAGNTAFSWYFSPDDTEFFHANFLAYVESNWHNASAMMAVSESSSKAEAVPEDDKAPKRDAPDRPKIPDVVGMNDQVAALHAAVSSRKPCLLVGPTGCGKTYLVNKYHEWMNKDRKKKGLSEIPLVVHTFHQDSSPAEILGKPTLKAGEVSWVESRFMEAFEKGGLYFADEFNFAPSGAHAPLFAALNGDEKILVPESGKTYERHPDFVFVAACNPASKYSGRQPLDKALASRFLVSATFGYLRPAQEKKLLIDRVATLTDAEAEKVVSFAVAMRKAENQGEVFYPFGTRDALHLAELVAKGFPWEKAVDFAFAGKIDNDEQAQIVMKAAGSDLVRPSFDDGEGSEKQLKALKDELAATRSVLDSEKKLRVEAESKLSKLKSALS